MNKKPRRVVLGLGYAESENEYEIGIQNRKGFSLRLDKLNEIDCKKIRLIAEVIE